MSSKQKSLKVNFIFSALYQVLILIVPLITAPYISRVLGPSGNGLYAYHYSIVQYFILVASFGFLNYGSQKIAEYRDNIEEKSKYFYGVMALKVVLGLSVFSLYILTCLLFFGTNKDILFLSLIFSIYILSETIDPLFYFRGEERFVSISVKNLAVKVINAILIFVLVKEKNDLLLYALVLALSQIVSIFFVYTGIKKNDICKVNIKTIEFRKIFKESFVYFIPSIAASLFVYLNQTLIGFFGFDTDESGYYSQALKIISILTAISSSFTSVVHSRISYLHSIKDEEEVERKIKKSFQAYWLISIPLTLGICSISKTFVPFFLGDEYSKSIYLVYILAPTIIFSPLNTLYSSIYFKPFNKIWIQTIILFASAFLNIIISLIMIPKFGAIGSCAGRLIAEFFQFPFLAFFSRKIINNNMVFKSLFKPLLSGAIMFVVVFLFDLYLSEMLNSAFLVIFIEVILGAIIYGVMEIVLKDEIVINNFKLLIGKLKKRK